jgi:hypothetical protein
MKKYAIALTVILSLQFAYNSARADDVGAVIGGASGLVLAGPPGFVIGVIVGGVWGKPWWGPVDPRKCYIDELFVRRCPVGVVVTK